jgi:UDP-N-acetylglucosamine transferase subunit ALG13
LILVTVGGQLPFDRLIRCVDAWAAQAGPVEVLAQIGDGTYQPQHLRWERSLAPSRFREVFARAEAVIGHAGIGTILTALELEKCLLVFPRRADHGEHRSDHQLGTARYFEQQGHVLAAYDEQEVPQKIDWMRRHGRPGGKPAPPSAALITRVRTHLLGRSRGT